MNSFTLAAWLVLLIGSPGIAAAHSLGWAVGQGGVILHSSTSGAIWAPQASGSTADLHGVAFTSYLMGFAVGDGGEILYTRDGGESWSTATSETTADLRAVSFGGAESAWAVGASGTIQGAGSVDYWFAHTSGTSETLDGVDFIDETTGWVVGSNGTIRRTSNNGSTWSAQTSGTSAFLRDVDFVDADTGWVVGAAGTILNTVDGGATWSPQVSGTLEGLRAVEFIDTATGWAVGDNNTLLRTVDGGATWLAAPEDPPYFSNFRGVAFVNANRGSAVGVGFPPALDGVALHTWTGGAKWDSRAVPESVQLEAMAFVRHSEHWAEGDPCRSQCELAASQCQEIPRSSFPDYPAAVQELVTWSSQFGCDEAVPAAVEGTCGNGEVLFTLRNGYFTGETRFYDSGTLRFTGLTTGTDYLLFPCLGSGYWPNAISCPNATVTAVHCGTLYSVGSPVQLPPDGSLPIEGAFIYPEYIPALSTAAGALAAASLLGIAAARLRRPPNDAGAR